MKMIIKCKCGNKEKGRVGSNGIWFKKFIIKTEDQDTWWNIELICKRCGDIYYL